MWDTAWSSPGLLLLPGVVGRCFTTPHAVPCLKPRPGHALLVIFLEGCEGDPGACTRSVTQ